MTAEHSANQSSIPPARLAPVIAALVIGAASLGFMAGMREPPPPLRSPPPHAQAGDPQRVPAAVPYSQMAESHPRPNANWHSQLGSLQFDTPDPFAPVIRTEERKQQALANRALWRAFDGAPPMIPHPAEQQTADSCLACHGRGAKVGEKVATRMSHPLLPNCTQCHVSATPPPFATAGEAVPSTFTGVYRAGPGERAWPGAPPTIPHATWMRQDCASCHGLIARPGLRTTHIWRTNCTQCHASSAALDQAVSPSLPLEPAPAATPSANP